MLGGVLEYLVSLSMQATPGQAMMAGALLGILPGLIAIIWGQLGGGNETEPQVPDETAILDQERELTCEICKTRVKMSVFGAHLATHNVMWRANVLRGPAAYKGIIPLLAARSRQAQVDKWRQE